MESEIGIVLREQHGVRYRFLNRGNLGGGADRRLGTEALTAKWAYVEWAINEFEIPGKSLEFHLPGSKLMSAISAIALAFSQGVE